MKKNHEATKQGESLENRLGLAELSGSFDAVSDKKTQNIDEKQQKMLKKTQKKELAKVLSNDKFSKKIISVRKSEIKTNKTLSKNNDRRIARCNKFLLSDNDEFRETYFTIDKFNTNGKKTLVFFNDGFFPVIDGVVSVMDNYATHLRDEFNVVVCAPKHKQTCYKMDKYLVLYCDAVYVKAQGYDLAFPQLDPIFQHFLSLLKIDLVHIQSPFNMGSFGLALAKKRKVPSFVTFHSQYKQNFYNAVKNEAIANWLTKVIAGVYKKADVAITMNDFARRVMNEYGIKRKIEIIPNATDLVEKKFDENFENSVLNKFNIKKDEFNILFIGRFVEVKNVYYILDVLGKLVKKTQNFNYIFMGYGPEMNKMQKVCAEKNLQNNVIFTGKVSNLDEKAVIIKNCNLLFFPSTYDTDGIVKIECACYGVPTLCIEDTGVGSNIVSEHNGFTLKNDKDAFVSKLYELINNPEFCHEVGMNAKKELYLTWDDVCKKLSNLYNSYLKTYHLKNAKQHKNHSAQKV